MFCKFLIIIDFVHDNNQENVYILISKNYGKISLDKYRKYVQLATGSQHWTISFVHEIMSTMNKYD